MTTPNQMPDKRDNTGRRIVGDLIQTVPASWTRKTLRKDEEGKEKVESVTVNYQALRYPLAQNVSEENVERAAWRWLK